MEDGERRGDGDSKANDVEGNQPITLVVLSQAKDEGRALLTDFQYWHVVKTIKRLVDFGDRPALADLDITQFGTGVYQPNREDYFYANCIR